MSSSSNTAKRGPWGMTDDDKIVLRVLVESGYFNRLRIAEIVECSLSTVGTFKRKMRSG